LYLGVAYEPIRLGSEEVYEAKLAVPCKVGQLLFEGRQAYPSSMNNSYLHSTQEKYDVTTATEPHGSSGGPLDTDVTVVTLNGALRPAEDCRATTREAKLGIGMGRVKNKRCRWG